MRIWPSLVLRARALADAEREALPLWLPVSLGLGIALWFGLPWAEQRLALGVALAGLGLALGFMSARWPAAFLLMIALGLVAAETRSRIVAHDVLRERTIMSFDARAVAIKPRAAREKLRLVLAVGTKDLPDRIRISVRGAAAERVLVQHGMAEGGRVRLRAMLMPPMGPAVP